MKIQRTEPESERGLEWRHGDENLYEHGKGAVGHPFLSAIFRRQDKFAKPMVFQLSLK